MKPKAYSYIRFSTPEQAKGDSLRRQAEDVNKIASDLKLELDDTLYLTDRGLSGYTGDNRTKGALGEFLRLVDEGKIATGSCLIIEKFDRLTREGMLIAVNLMTGILLKGIDLYTKIDNKHFTKDKFDITDLIISAIKLEQGNQFSTNLSYNLRKAWIKKRADAINGKRKMSRGCPLWLEPVPLVGVVTGYKPIKERVAVIRLIFEMKLAGKGSDRIAQDLNRMKNIWKPQGRKDKTTGIRKQSAFNTSYIDLILHNNRKLIGELQLHRYTKEDGKRKNIPDGEVIKNYYPAIIDIEVFNRVQEIMNANSKKDGRGGGRGDKVNNLFSHMAVCGRCNSAMRYMNHGNELLWSNHFRCVRVVQGFDCDGTKLYYKDVEYSVLKYCKGLDVATILPNHENALSELSVLNNQLQAIDGKINEVLAQMKAIEDTSLIAKNPAYIKALEHRYATFDLERVKLEADKKDIQEQIKLLSINGKHTEEQINNVKELIALMDKLRQDKANEQELINLRLNLRTHLRRLIKVIKVHAEEKRVAIFFNSGQRRLINIATSEVVIDAYPKKIYKNV